MSYIPEIWTSALTWSEAMAFTPAMVADQDMSYEDDAESRTLDHGEDEEMEGRDIDGNGGEDDGDDVSDTFSWMSDLSMDNDDDDEEGEEEGGDGDCHAAETEQDTMIPIYLAPAQGTIPRGCRCLSCCRAFVDRVSSVLDLSLSQYINDALAEYSYGRYAISFFIPHPSHHLLLLLLLLLIHRSSLIFAYHTHPTNQPCTN